MKANRPAPVRGTGQCEVGPGQQGGAAGDTREIFRGPAGDPWGQGRGMISADWSPHGLTLNVTTLFTLKWLLVRYMNCTSIKRNLCWKKNNLGHISFLHQILQRLPEANPTPCASHPQMGSLHTPARREPRRREGETGMRDIKVKSLLSGHHGEGRRGAF